MKSKLKAIAQLISGLYTKPDIDGEVYYVQAKHFNSNGDFDFSVKPDLKLEGKIEKHLLKTGDILLVAKGGNNFAVQYKGLIQKAVASSIFIVIRIKDQDAILADYLTWYLNHPQTQLLLKEYSKGSGIPSIAINVLSELEVYIPPLVKQRTIIELYKLRKKEKEITFYLETLREKYIQQQLLNSIKQ